MKEKLKYALHIILLLSFFMYSTMVYKLPLKTVVGQSHDMMAGKAIWQKKNCGACHQLYGLGGFLGPDITNVYSAPGKGPEYIKAFVKTGTQVMPSFNLSDAEFESLLSFLQHIDASGISDPKIFKRHWDGTIELK